MWERGGPFPVTPDSSSFSISQLPPHPSYFTFKTFLFLFFLQLSIGPQINTYNIQTPPPHFPSTTTTSVSLTTHSDLPCAHCDKTLSPGRGGGQACGGGDGAYCQSELHSRLLTDLTHLHRSANSTEATVQFVRHREQRVADQSPHASVCTVHV